MITEAKVEEGGETKLCPGCGEMKNVDLDMGYRLYKGRIYKQSHCKKCRSKKRVKVAETVPMSDAQVEQLVENIGAFFGVDDACKTMGPGCKGCPDCKGIPAQDIIDALSDSPAPVPVLIIETNPNGLNRSRKKADLVVDVNLTVEDRQHWSRLPVKSAEMEIIDGKPSSPWFEKQKLQTEPQTMEREYPLGCPYIYDVEVHGKPSPRRCEKLLPCGFHSTANTREELTKLYRAEFPADKGNGSITFRPIKFMADKLLRKLEKDNFHAGNSDLINSIGALCQK